MKEYVRVFTPQERTERWLVHIHSSASHLIQISRRRTNQAWRRKNKINGERYEVQERGTLKARPRPSQPNIRGGIGAAVRPPIETVATRRTARINRAYRGGGNGGYVDKDGGLLYLRQGCLGAVERACLMRVIVDLAVFLGGMAC